MRLFEKLCAQKKRRAEKRSLNLDIHNQSYAKLRDKSRDPNGKGWAIDPTNPNKLFVAGAPATFTQVWGYTLEGLEREYIQLKRQLKARYPDFTPERILLQVEVHYAGKIMADSTLRQQLKPYGFSNVQYVYTEIQMDGDTIVLRIAGGGYYEGYGFFVYGHPEGCDDTHHGPDSGHWCRPTPDDLSLAADERTV